MPALAVTIKFTIATGCPEDNRSLSPRFQSWDGAYPNKPTLMKYFAYGSNMLESRLRARVPGCRFFAVGRLPGYALRFHKVGRDGSAKCSVVKAEGADDCVIGVIYDIDPMEKIRLDLAESLGQGYNEEAVVLETDNGPVTAYCYVADPAYIDDSLKPFDWYLAYVVGGAREHQFPADYIRDLEGVEAIDTSDASVDAHR